MFERLTLLYYENTVIAEIYVLTLKFHRENTAWLGQCIELGTAMFADTLEDVRRELHEAVVLQVNEMARLSDAKAYLADHGVLPLCLPQSPAACEGFVAVDAVA